LDRKAKTILFENGSQKVWTDAGFFIFLVSGAVSAEKKWNSLLLLYWFFQHWDI